MKKKKKVPKLRQEVKVKVDIVTRDDIKIYYTGKFQDFTARYIINQYPVQSFSVILRGVPLPHSNALQYYVKREKNKVNDVIFPSGCEARAINLGNKNMKIGISLVIPV